MPRATAALEVSVPLPNCRHVSDLPQTTANSNTLGASETVLGTLAEALVGARTTATTALVLSAAATTIAQAILRVEHLGVSLFRQPVCSPIAIASSMHLPIFAVCLYLREAPLTCRQPGVTARRFLII